MNSLNCTFNVTCSPLTLTQALRRESWGRTMKVLLADSNLEAMRLLRETAKALGHEVVGQAISGSELIELASTLKPDVIITEVLLSGTNGLEASLQIYERRPVPIVVLSSYKEREVVERGYDSHVMSYLLKPSSIAQIDAAITMAVKQHERIRGLISENTLLANQVEDLRLIARAKGILMEKGKMTEAQAHNKLQRLSKEKNVKMGEIARSIITVTEVLTDCRKKA